MKFQIEEVIEGADSKVEVRARLEDGRLACVTAAKGDARSYEAAVSEYIAAAHPPEPEGVNGEE